MSERAWVRLEWMVLMVALMLFSIVATLASPAYGSGYDTGDPKTPSIILSTDPGIVAVAVTLNAPVVVAYQVVVPVFNIAGHDTGDPKTFSERNEINSMNRPTWHRSTKGGNGVLYAVIVGKYNQ